MMALDRGPAEAVVLSPRQRWSMVFSFVLIGLGLIAGASLRDSSLNQSLLYSNVEAGITARYPLRWLLSEAEDYVFRVEDTAQPGFKTLIEVRTLPVGPDTSERNLLDRLSLRRSQTLIDYSVLDYDIYVLPDDTAAVTMSYSYVSRDTSPFLEGLSSIVAGLDLLAISRGQAVIVSFRADASVFKRDRAILDRFMQSLEF